MNVQVKFFAAPREALDESEIEIAIPERTTAAELIDLLIERYPVLRVHTRFLNVAVNKTYVSMQTELHDGDEIALLPPVGGG
jgi:molybdopterin converting factor subunit 1